MLKNRLLFTIALFLIICSQLYAFSNDDFSVDDKGWNGHKEKESVIFFLDEEPDENDIDYYRPTIEVFFQKTEKIFIPNYDNKDLKTIEDAVKNTVYKNHYEAIKSAREISGIKTASERKIELEELEESSGIRGSSYTKFGDRKSFKVDFQIGEYSYSCYIIFAYGGVYRITTITLETRSFNSIKAFDTFKKSFRMKAPAATMFNYYSRQYGPYLFIGIFGIIIELIKRRFKSN